MTWKDPGKQGEAIRKHYYANRQYYIDKASKKRLTLRKWVYDLKSRTPCKDCGIQYPYYVTDFDHIEEKGEKIAAVSKMINSGSIRRVKEEIAKCELVCANCHRERTQRRKSSNNSV